MTVQGPRRGKRWPWLPRYVAWAVLLLGLAGMWAVDRYYSLGLFWGVTSFAAFLGGVFALLLLPCPRCGAVLAFTQFNKTCRRCGQGYLAPVEPLEPASRRSETPIR
jgi:hypothetical protein